MLKNTSQSCRKVETQLSFALYSAVSRVIKLHKPLLEPLGITFPQYLVMLELFQDAPRTVGELGTKLSMDTGTITPILKRLQASDMVTRTRDVVDERRVLIDLTTRSEALREELWRVTDQVSSSCQLADKEMTELRNKLDALVRYSSD